MTSGKQQHSIPNNNLLCISNFPPNTGFAWDYIDKTFRSLAENTSNKVYIAYPQLHDKEKECQQNMLTCLELDWDHSSLSFIRILKAIRRHQIKTLYLIDQSPVSLKYFICRLFGVKRIINHYHRPYANPVNNRIKNTIKRYLSLLYVDVVICNSRFTKNHIRASLPIAKDQIITIYNGIPYDAYQKVSAILPRSLRHLSNKKIILMNSRLHKEKGVAILIKAFNKVKQISADNSLHLLCCGDGPHRQEMAALSKQLHLHEVTFTGYIGHGDLLKIIACSYLTCIPSLVDEGFSLASIESMAMATPVIASHAGALPEIIRDSKEGILVPRNSVSALADAIISLINNEQQYQLLQQVAKKRAYDFNYTKTIQQLSAAIFTTSSSLSRQTNKTDTRNNQQ